MKLFALLLCLSQNLSAPAGDSYAVHNPSGVTIIPNGRLLEPIGTHYPLARFPHGMAISRNGALLFIPSDGVGQLVTNWQSGSPKITELKPPASTKRIHLNAGGADFSPDGTLLYWSSGERGTIFVFDTATGNFQFDINLNTAPFNDSFAVDVKLSADGRYLYCADVTNFRLAVIDTTERRTIGSVPVGRYPYALTVSGNNVLVANIGLFEYSSVPVPTGPGFDPRGLTRPPFGYPSKEAREGVEFEGRKIPGLGDDNALEAFSVWNVDVSRPDQPKVASRFKTGLLIHSPADNGTTVGGSAPNFLTARDNSLFVSNGNNDMIERYDLTTGKLAVRKRLVPSPLVARLRGVGPSGMTLSPDGRRLYVTESGINAIAVLDSTTLNVLGHIPTAWYPYRVAISPDGRHMHDPSLLRWGLNQTIQEPGQPVLQNVPVMVNHNALARQFTVSDNFYLEPEASGVGHRWLVGVQPNNLMQMTYTLGWTFNEKSTAPGRRYSMGSNGSLMPEDYPEAGSMWEHLARHRVPFRNYGEGFEFPGVKEEADEHPTGAREVVNIPMPKVLYDNTSFDYPIYNTNIPDQYRAHWFIKDVEQRFLSGKHKFPSFVNIAICNDHGAARRPDKGYPYLASYMADNDLALGRIVEFLSHTPYWKNMAIFVTEDDSGGEPDHVDAQRSFLLVISPWAKKGYVTHRHTTILSMHRTLYNTFGLPPLNMFDALASDLSDAFTNKPDFRPYQARKVDPRIFDPEKAKDPKDPDYGQARRTPFAPMDDPEEMERILKQGEKKK
ncbi:MAG: bifunctional YncE family protein/alkaline phosphatase family protein [Acidobacteria bacterium]|nr:bifunctional YncE family protein/alkaline phosphatase family protein [Acidobacteriota bacterium]